MVNYKNLFEWKFKETHNNKYMNLFEKIYYNFSASTYNEKRLFKNINKFINWSNNKILDIGCWWWHENLTSFWDVYWVDVSSESLKNSSKIYHEVKELDATNKLPYPDSYFDFIFSSEVFWHIKYEDKDMFLSEAKRVLKKSWKIIMTIETYWNNWFVRFLEKKWLYQKYWIDYQWHIWLLTAEETIELLRKYFDILNYEKTSTWLMPIDWYMILKDKYSFLKYFENNIIRRLLNMFFYPLYLISLKFSNLNSANDILIVCEKNND